MVSEGIYIKYSDALDRSVISVMPLTCWQASPPSANTSMKTSWGHGKFVPKKRCPWRVLIAVRPVTIVAICSLFRPAKKIIESEITFLSLFKSVRVVSVTEVSTTMVWALVCVLYRAISPWLCLATSAPNPPDQYGPSNHLPHLIKTPSLPLWEASKGTVRKGGHADKTSLACFAGLLHNRGLLKIFKLVWWK